MSLPNVPPQTSTPVPLKRGIFRREHGGWLILFCLASLLLHLGAGVTSRAFDFGLPKTLPTPKPVEVEIALAPPPPVVDKPAATVPQAFAPAAPVVKPHVVPTPPPRRAAPRPPKTVPKEFVLPSLHNTTTTPRKIQTQADHSPKPLPLGLRNGRRDLPEITFTPRPQPLPSVVSTPLPLQSTPPPIRLQANTGARSGGGAGVPLDLPSVLTPDAPVRPALGNVAPNTPLTGGKNGGSGGGTGGGIGKGASAGNATGTGPLSDTRGIPFGDRSGVAHGDPNGGGGGGYKHTIRSTLPPGNTDDTPPVHIVYVFDTSGSMEEGGKIKRAREALQKALTELRADDTFNVVPFSDRARVMFPAMQSVSEATIKEANAAIDSDKDFLTPTGDTNLSEALDLALGQEAVTDIFVLSDGKPTQGITRYGNLLKHIRSRNTHKVHIMTLALGLGEKFEGMSLLRALAEQNGGKFDYVNLKGR